MLRVRLVDQRLETVTPRPKLLGDWVHLRDADCLRTFLGTQNGELLSDAIYLGGI